MRGSDQLPVLLRDREHAAIAEQPVHLDIADTGALLHQVPGSVQVGAAVHHHPEPVRHHAVLGVLAGSVELHVRVTRQGWRAVPPLVAQIVEFQSAVRILDDRHVAPAFSCGELSAIHGKASNCHPSV